MRGYCISAITPASQAGKAGSTPVIRLKTALLKGLFLYCCIKIGRTVFLKPAVPFIVFGISLVHQLIKAR